MGGERGDGGLGVSVAGVEDGDQLQRLAEAGVQLDQVGVLKRAFRRRCLPLSG